MSNASVHIHPRRLYELVRACPSPEARIKAAFQFLVGTSQTTQAFLFMARAGELVMVDSVPEQAPLPGLLEEAKRAWRSDQTAQVEDDRTKTMDIRTLEALQQPTANPTWLGPNGVSYEHAFLSLYRDGAWAFIGVFMFKPSELAATPAIRRTHLDALCNAFVDAGDASFSPR